jgi:hypothetical protein
LHSAQGEMGGYRQLPRGDEASWNDMVGWIEEQGEEETQGFARRFPSRKRFH